MYSRLPDSPSTGMHRPSTQTVKPYPQHYILNNPPGWFDLDRTHPNPYPNPPFFPPACLTPRGWGLDRKGRGGDGDVLPLA